LLACSFRFFEYVYIHWQHLAAVSICSSWEHTLVVEEALVLHFFWTYKVFDVISQLRFNFFCMIIINIASSAAVILWSALWERSLSTIISSWSSWNILVLGVHVGIEFKWDTVVVQQLLNNVVGSVLLIFLQKTISLQHQITTLLILVDHYNSEFWRLLIFFWILVFIFILITIRFLKAVHSILFSISGLKWQLVVRFSELIFSMSITALFAKFALSIFFVKWAQLSFVIVVWHVHHFHHEARW